MQADRFHVTVLGPLRVWASDGTEATPAGLLPRRLLALLVLRRGTALSVDAAIEALWPTGVPKDPVAALHNHISRLRRALPNTLSHVAGGYRLDPAAIEVDIDQLASAVTATVGDLSAAERVESLLRSWQGPAYPELDEVPDARAEVQRAAELHVRAQEFRAEHCLAKGAVDGLAAGLRTLVDAHPFRERPRALLMEVLASTGRRAEALRIYDEFRRLLANELGTEPSAALAARHQQLLQDAGLGEWSAANRLPAPTTSLIGREPLVRALCGVVADTRLVTLVGPGGVGKTRVLLELGHRLAGENAHVPVVLCELAQADGATAVEIVAAALRIDVRPGAPLADRIASVVGGSSLVLLLDNCEHVLDPLAELVETLLARCVGLRLVATSRERFRVAGEHVRSVPPLPGGSPDSPAVELFVERARAAADDVTVDDHTLERIAAIVARLDGLPLAIELAAARMHSHDVEEIEAGIAERWDFLSAGYRTSLRHGSLAAAITWSFDLLQLPLRRMFTDVAVFSGPFDLAAAAAVCGVDQRVAGVRLTTLVERSLVMRYPGRRYLLLETLRAFGWERLEADGRGDEICERHARFMVEWVELANRRLAVPSSGAIRQIDEAIVEVQRAVVWLIDHGEPEFAGAIVASLLDYGLLRLRPDVLGWAERVIAADPEDTSGVAAQVWAAGAYAAWMTGDLTAAAARAKRALVAATAAGVAVPAHVFGANGVCALFDGRLGESAAWYEAAARAAAQVAPAYWPIPAGTRIMVLGYAHHADAPRLAAELAARTGDTSSPYAAYAWYCAGEAVLENDPQEARTRLERALVLAEATDTAFVTGVAGASKASLDVRTGALDAAARAYKQLIPHWRRAGMWPTQHVMLRWIAVLLFQSGHPEDAAMLDGAIRAASTGQPLSGTDEATVNALSHHLRVALGDERYEAALRRGAEVDPEALLDHTIGVL